MAYSFYPDYIFTKGVGYAEFFDPATDNLLGYSPYVGDFGLSGSQNNGDIEGGVGNMLIMMIPDSSRMSVTCTTVDDSLENTALVVGASLKPNGVVETIQAFTAEGTTLAITGTTPVAPLGGSHGAVAYVMTSSGNDANTVKANSGIAYPVAENGVITGFTAVSGNTYCVKYFTQNSSAMQLDIPALFAAKVVRAHFAINCYAKNGGDAMESSLYKIRHYYFPYYFFTGAMANSVSNTTTGTVDLSGSCLTYEEAISSGSCASTGAQKYGFIVDEYIGTSTAGVDGIFFIGLGDGVSVAADETVTLPVKYSVNGQLANISDMTAVTFSTGAESVAKFSDEHSNILLGVSATGSPTYAEVSVTNSATGVVYKDTIPVTVTAS